MGDLETALAFVARRAGARAMPPAAWVHHLSLELAWMAPAQARAFVERAMAAGVLRLAGDDAELAFDPRAVEAPRGFRPNPDTGAAPPEDPFVAWLGRVGAATGKDRAAVLADVAARQQAMGGMLTAWAALLWAAADAGLDVRSAAQASAG
ncbi:MAG: hypothetical protein QOD77_1817 [Thermoplasmata archaeon]|jgi:hypothetical protein|nr:hypothetical protein [Thermoplasmata archaeon]